MATMLDLRPGDAMAPRSPASAMMQASRDAQAAKDAEQRAKEQRAQAEEKRQQEAAKIAEQQNVRAQQASDLSTRKASVEFDADVAKADVGEWLQNPSYQKPFNEAPPEVREHFSMGTYGPAAPAARAAWDAELERRGAIQHNPQQGETITVHPSGEVSRQIQAVPAPGVPSDIRSELIRLKAWRDGMTPEEASEARDDAYLKNGMIPERYQKQATTLAAQLVHHPILAPFAKQKEAYDTMKSGFENPQAGGFGDMAMIEGFQRIVNPGAVVRQQTMNQMLQAAGLGQYASWDFLRNKIAQGDKLSPEARTRLMNLAEQTFTHAKQTAARELQAKQRYARMLGIPNAEAFVNNVLDYVAQQNEGEAPATSAQPAATAAQPALPKAPAIGEVRDGYRFLGGNPSDQKSWQQVGG